MGYSRNPFAARCVGTGVSEPEVAVQTRWLYRRRENRLRYRRNNPMPLRMAYRMVLWIVQLWVSLWRNPAVVRCFGRDCDTGVSDPEVAVQTRWPYGRQYRRDIRGFLRISQLWVIHEIPL
jgi:hypothetical protein